MAYFGRGLNKVKSPYTFKDMYKAYLEDIGDNELYNVTYSEFVSICTHFYKSIMKYIFGGGIFIMPFGLGSVSIIKRKPKQLKPKSLQIDWFNSVKYKKRVYHLNDHSNYFKFRFYWSKKNTRLLHKGMYNLVFTRENKRELAALIKSGHTNYFEL